MFELDEIVFELLKTKPFYAHMLRQCRISLDSKFPSAAGVIVKGTIEMKLNPEKMAEMPLDVQAGVIEHELKHLFHDHISDYHKLGAAEAALVNRSKNHYAFNVAADAQINPTIPSLVNDPKRGLEAMRKIKEIHKLHGHDEQSLKEALSQVDGDWTFVFPENFDMADGHHWTTYYKALLLKYQDEKGDQQMQQMLGEMDGDMEGGDGEGQGDQQGDQDGKGGSEGDDQKEGPNGHSYFKESLSDQEVLDAIISKAVKTAKQNNLVTLLSW